MFLLGWAKINMSSRLQRTCARLLYLVLVFTPSGASADCHTSDLNTTTGIACTNQSGVTALFGQGGILMNIINILIAIVGITAVFALIIGSFRFIFSGGKAETLKGAKDTILYAMIGVVVAVLAFAMINFVLVGLK